MTNSNKSIPDSYHQGYCYFDVTTGKFWIDTTNDASGRLAINGANTIYGEISRETVSGPYELSYAYDNYKTVLDEGCILIVTAKNDIAAEAQVIIDKTTEELIYIYQNNLPLQGNIIQANDTVLLAYYNGRLNLIENFTAQEKKEKTANIYYIKGSGSTTGVAGSRASVWRGQLPIQLDDYYDGLTVLYVPDVPGVAVQVSPGDGPTGGGGVRLELSDNTNTTINNNHNICYYNNTAINTQYPVGVPILLTYTNDKWVSADYNTNTTYSFAEGTNSFTVTPSDGIGQTVTIIPSISLTANTAAAITNSFAIINSVTATGTTSHTITVSSKKLTATSGITMTATATQITVKHTTLVTAATSYGNTNTYVKSINIDIYGHITGATTGTYSDADEKVNQVLTTSGSMPILFSSNNNTNTATTVNGDVLRNNNIYGNLETGVLYSNGLGISGSTTITGALNVTGNTNLHNETYAESLTTGSLLTTGNVNFVQIPTAPTANDETNNNQLATTEFVKKQFKANDAMQFKGIVNSNSDLPSTAETGYVYRVGTADTYANEECEIGDMIICISNESGTSPTWGVIQTNLDGAIIGPASSEANHVAVFTGNTGKALKDSGFIFNPTSSQIASVDEASTPGIYTYKGSIPYSGATHYGTLTVLGPSTYASTILISSSNGCSIPVMGISRKMGGSGSSYFMPVGVFSSTEIASNRVIISDGVQGNIKASNFTIGTSVPATAVFTDTTYSAATTADLGLTQYTAANLDTQINQLTTGSTTPSRDDYMIIQYKNGGTTTETYHRKAVSTIFGALNNEDITTALGYTPYDSSNPNGYTSNTGTVTSITISAGTGISVTSTTAAITSSGTRTISLANTYGDTKNPYGSKTANYVLAGPINGSSAVPGFRKLVEADLPNSYLPLSGGTVTGSILPGDNNITLGNNTTAWSAIYANEFYGDGSNLTNLPTTYWANIETTSAATFNAAPEMAILTLNGNTTATTAATAGVSLVFSAVTNSLNFIFM